MRRDREWMYERLKGKYVSSEFLKKLEEFIEFACGQEEYIKERRLRCPCSKCMNTAYRDVDTVRMHLFTRGFRDDYYCWTHHGEPYVEVEVEAITSESTSSKGVSNPYQDMVIDAFGPRVQHDSSNSVEDPLPEAKEFFNMLEAAGKPMYDGCEMSMLSVAARIINLKCEYNIPHRAVDGIASLIRDVCPTDNSMPETYYNTRKLLAALELPHKKIDVCPDGCMLFWKEHIGLDKCLICNKDRYKSKKTKGKPIANKVLTYLPITPRLQRLYAAESTAKQMRWHAENPRVSGCMSHPSDGEAWKKFDALFPSFAADPRNVRLGLCTDGFSPFGNSGKQYSCWPVILTPYNLPPWMCMKRQFMFLSLIIPGPKSPKGKLDVYLQPLIEELKQLWDVGAMTYDVSKKQNFEMKASLLWTISDFPAYGMLSGWMTAGRLACPYCMENTKSFSLVHGRKQTWFDCHRQFLPHDHVFRKDTSAFIKNKVEDSHPPPRLTGAQLWECVCRLPKTTDRAHSNTTEALEGIHFDHNWRKQSIFWELPYWGDLLIRHNLDVMHIEKNVFDNVIHTIMDVKGKTKDNINARKDLEIFCKRKRLHLQTDACSGSSRLTMPKAPYVLSKERRKVLCEWVKQLKFPDGYASNISRCVDNQSYKFFGMKSHDCHVFMERLIPVAFRELLPANVWKAITELSQFFRDLSSTVLRTEDMVRLEKNIPEILCKLEKIFPPGFFNCMEHLPIHLPYEAKVGGPVQYRWMYPFERFLHHLKRKIGNKAFVEGSICNAYLTEEISNFCTNYFEPNIDTKSRDLGRNVGRNFQQLGDKKTTPFLILFCWGYYHKRSDKILGRPRVLCCP